MHMTPTGFTYLGSSKGPFWVLYGVIILSVIRTVVLQTCGSTNLTENSTFSSPGYPSNYRSYAQCSWSISVPEGYVAVLRFRNFRIESCSSCGCDYLSVYDGLAESSPVLARLCGSSLPAPVYATQNKMFVKFVSDGSVAYDGFFGTVETGRVLIQFIESENGTIQSPNYPSNYEPLKRYVWNITVPENYQIFLEFLDFETQENTECSKDYVEVRDGQELSSSLLGRFCGTNVQKYMRSSGNKLIIIFQSDESHEAKGFSAEFRKAEICGSTIVGRSGNLNSPNYPNNYGPVERCRWKIVAPEDHHVIIRFLTFNIADTGSCSKDYVKIFNGNDTNTAPTLGRFCGNNIPNVTRSSSNEVTVEFMSDPSDEAQGFSARFETDYCGEEFHSDSGTFHSPNFPNEYGHHEMCTWKITVPEGYRVAVRFDTFQLESSYSCNADSVRVFDGLNGSTPELEKICGVQDLQKKVYSTGNTLSVRFVTDASYSKSGFSASYIKAPIPVPSSTTDVPAPCHQDVKSDSGTVNSPRYPQMYLPNLNCVWKIEVPEGKLVRLQFQSFDLEDEKLSCNFDYVEVLDGDKHLGKYCGANDPQPQWSTSNKMSVRFVSDGAFEYPGFSATFIKADHKEENISNVDTGTFKSPNYPNKYEPLQKHIWQISVPNHYKIVLTFLSFALEYSQNCTDDSLAIYDGEISDTNLLGKFCGTSAPADIRSSANKLTVVFTTDASEELSGFQVKFEKEAICGDDSCRNFGTCRKTRGVDKCFCQYGYQGNLCEEKTLCSNNTCEHGGLCFQNGTGGTIHCVCSHGYEGSLCHERILCGNETCRNGGYCTHGGKNGILLCVCEPGFEGLFCERALAKSAGSVASIVIPVVILLAIASAVVLFLLIRRRLKQQPYDNMKHTERIIDKDETFDS